MTDALPKSRTAKAVDPNYCEFLGRACHSKACNFGCKELRGRPWVKAKSAPVAPDAPSPIETEEVPIADLVIPEETSISMTEIVPETIEPAPLALAAEEHVPESVEPEAEIQEAAAPASEVSRPAPEFEGKEKQRRPRRPKPLVLSLPTEASDAASGDMVSVLTAALAGLEHVDLIMSMAARMLGVSQTGTALEGMRDTKRRLNALIAELSRKES